MADYMAYWKTDQVRTALEEAERGVLLDHAASQQFGKVRPGDTVWIVNIERHTHRFLLIGRIEVRVVCGQRAAEQDRGRGRLWEAPYHILAIHGSEEAPREIPLAAVAHRLRFVSPEPRDRLTLVDRQVDQQQVRRLRELVPDTVDLFEQLWREASGGDARRAGERGEELLPNREYIEGGAVRVLVNRYERDREARAACIAHHGAACTVCEMDFADTYGPLGQGFIHVHHLVSVSSRGARYRVNPVTDLVPVCPNCHAMLHTGQTSPSVPELRRIVRRRRPS